MVLEYQYEIGIALRHRYNYIPTRAIGPCALVAPSPAINSPPINDTIACSIVNSVASRLGLVGSVASSRVVDLAAVLAALVGPWEVCDGNDEEAEHVSLADMVKDGKVYVSNVPVGAICDTSESIVPGSESSEETKSATGDDASFLRGLAVVLQVSDTKQ